MSEHFALTCDAPRGMISQTVNSHIVTMSPSGMWLHVKEHAQGSDPGSRRTSWVSLCHCFREYEALLLQIINGELRDEIETGTIVIP